MRKSKNFHQDQVLTAIQKQYKTILVLVKLVASLSSDLTKLSAQVEKQEVLINKLLAGSTMEEQTV